MRCTHSKPHISANSEWIGVLEVAGGPWSTHLHHLSTEYLRIVGEVFSLKKQGLQPPNPGFLYPSFLAPLVLGIWGNYLSEKLSEMMRERDRQSFRLKGGVP